MEFGFTTAAYVVAAVLFILSLGGLSGQESAKRAVWYGIVGMALAVVATLIGPGSGLWFLSLLLIAGGGVIGTYVAKKVQMTEMPQLVAAMHSLVWAMCWPWDQNNARRWKVSARCWPIKRRSSRTSCGLNCS